MPARYRQRPSAARQTAAPAEMLREEIASYDALFREVYRQPAYNPDDLAGSRGIDIYDRMMTDAQVRASINTKRYALLAHPWLVIPAIQDPAHPDFAAAQEIREFTDDALRGMRSGDGSGRDLRSALFDMMSAFYRGFSLAEMIWRVEEKGRWKGRIVLDRLKFKHPRQIGFDLDEFLNIRSITSLTPGFGLQEVPRGKCVLHVYGQRDELPYGDSDLRSVYRHYYSKVRIMEFWNLRLQRFGIPFAYASVGSGKDSIAARVAEVLQEFQQNSTAVFPANIRPELLESRAGGDEPFLNALDWHNQQIAVGVLLQTLTSAEGRRSGSLALGKVHFDILLFALKCAKQEIESTVNQQIIRPLVEHNFEEPHIPRFSLGNLDEKDIVQLAQAMQVLLSHGVVDSREPALREMFNLPPITAG